jgi:hypothetical protein
MWLSLESEQGMDFTLCTLFLRYTTDFSMHSDLQQMLILLRTTVPAPITWDLGTEQALLLIRYRHTVNV